MQTLRVKANEVQEGDFLPGLGDAYVFQAPETGDGYLSYPMTDGGMSAAMPEDTVVISFHDRDGEENYLIVQPEFEIQVNRGAPI